MHKLLKQMCLPRIKSVANVEITLIKKCLPRISWRECLNYLNKMYLSRIKSVANARITKAKNAFTENKMYSE
jgi:hypothetical protein